MIFVCLLVCQFVSFLVCLLPVRRLPFTHTHTHRERLPLSLSVSCHTSFSHSNNLCTFLMAATQAAPAGFGRITTRFQFVARFNYHVPTQKAALSSHLHTARRHLSAQPTALPCERRRALWATFLSAAFWKPVKSPSPAWEPVYFLALNLCFHVGVSLRHLKCISACSSSSFGYKLQKLCAKSENGFKITKHEQSKEGKQKESYKIVIE